MPQSKPTSCRWCGVSLNQSGPGRPKRYCSHAHRTRHHEWRRLCGIPVSLPGLAIRDGYRCGICSGPVDLAAVGRLAPTVDHIVPVARGGTHAVDNLQIAHSACNNRKLDRVGFTCPPIGGDAERPLTLF